MILYNFTIFISANILFKATKDTCGLLYKLIKNYCLIAEISIVKGKLIIWDLIKNILIIAGYKLLELSSTLC